MDYEGYKEGNESMLTLTLIMFVIGMALGWLCNELYRSLTGDSVMKEIKQMHQDAELNLEFSNRLRSDLKDMHKEMNDLVKECIDLRLDEYKGKN